MGSQLSTPPEFLSLTFFLLFIFFFDISTMNTHFSEQQLCLCLSCTVLSILSRIAMQQVHGSQGLLSEYGVNDNSHTVMRQASATTLYMFQASPGNWSQLLQLAWARLNLTCYFMEGILCLQTVGFSCTDTGSSGEGIQFHPYGKVFKLSTSGFIHLFEVVNIMETCCSFFYSGLSLCSH